MNSTYWAWRKVVAYANASRLRKLPNYRNGVVKLAHGRCKGVCVSR
jgi:hypothetical protein